MRQQTYIRLDSASSARSSEWTYGPDSPTIVLSCDARTRVATLRHDGRTICEWNDPLAALTSLVDDAWGRWIGFISYDFGRLFERIPESASDDLDLPLYIFHHHPLPRWSSASEPPLARIRKSGMLRSSFSRDEYLNVVARAIEYIRAGDIFQVNLSQRLSVRLPAQPAEIYARLLEQTPAEYGALLCYEDFAMICNSPELFLRVTPDRRVITRPIKGTRPRRAGMEIELRDSAKDQAELNMIVDLERNDLGRVCEIGSVKVTEPRVIEAHPTVYHGVATIEGQLRDDVKLVDLLRATFPGGSVTGAPKIRAMEIIEEFEPVRRGPYCGAIGYIAADGSMEFNVAIRTMIVKDGLVHIPVGGGIVADSDPASEYEETLVKAKAMFDALGIEVPR